MDTKIGAVHIVHIVHIEMIKTQNTHCECVLFTVVFLLAVCLKVAVG